MSAASAGRIGGKIFRDVRHVVGRDLSRHPDEVVVVSASVGDASVLIGIARKEAEEWRTDPEKRQVLDARPAKHAGVGMMTVHQFERDGSQPRRATQAVVRHAFEAAGVEFIDGNGAGPGVRLRAPTAKKSKEK
jgi:hypothetical protein